MRAPKLRPRARSTLKPHGQGGVGKVARLRARSTLKPRGQGGQGIARIKLKPRARHAHRLEAVEKSPVLAHLSESFNGLSTIRALSASCLFTRRALVLLDRFTAVHRSGRAAEYWVPLLAPSLPLSLSP